MEKFGLYNFRIYRNPPHTGWVYEIFDDQGKLLRQSNESYVYEGIARFAVIGHISLLEQGKG